MALIDHVLPTMLCQKWMIFPKIQICISRFNDILISATTIHVGKSKPSKKFKPWMTPHVWAKICSWNCLCWTIHQNQQEWINACCEAFKAINEAKTENWKDLLQDAMSNSDGPNMWQGLNGAPTNSPPQNGRTITNIKSKVNVFINHYTRVSKLNMSQVDQSQPSIHKNDSPHHLLTMKAVLLFKWVSYYMPSKRWKTKEQLHWHSTIISQVTWSFGPPGITILTQLIFFSCSLSKNLEGCYHYSITESWEMS